MTSFTVLVQKQNGQGTYVEAEAVIADYVKQELGALVFRRHVHNSYPEIVKAFAPGRWLEVTGG